MLTHHVALLFCQPVPDVMVVELAPAVTIELPPELVLECTVVALLAPVLTIARLSRATRASTIALTLLGSLPCGSTSVGHGLLHLRVHEELVHIPLRALVLGQPLDRSEEHTSELQS